MLTLEPPIVAQSRRVRPSVKESELAKSGEFVGSGYYREAWRVPGGQWVYKYLSMPEDSEGATVNIQEYLNYIKWRNNLPKGVKMPDMVLLKNGVLAARYVEGTLADFTHMEMTDDWRYVCDCKERHHLAQCWRDMVNGISLRDVHGQNVMISKKKIYLIDIGEYCVPRDY